MNWDLLQPILAGMVRHALTAAGGALVADGVLQSSAVPGFVGAGVTVAGVAWSWWQKVGQAEVSELLKKLTAKATVAAATAAAQAAAPGAAVKVIALLAILILGTLLVPTPGYAQTRDRLGVPGGIIHAPGAVLSGASGAGAADACDLNLFAKGGSSDSVLAQIQQCVSEKAATLLPDWQAALASATDKKDTTAINCLTPAVAIIQAAVGTPAVVADPNATPPVVGKPAVLPGPITLLQKVREFLNAGGKAACKEVLNTTNAMLLAP